MVVLKYLESSLYIRKEEYTKSLKREAEKLTLTDIITELDVGKLARDFSFRQGYKFNNGENISFHLNSISISISPDKLIVSYDEIRVKEFCGDDVKSFYDVLSAQIQQEVKSYIENIPF